MENLKAAAGLMQKMKVKSCMIEMDPAEYKKLKQELFEYFKETGEWVTGGALSKFYFSVTLMGVTFLVNQTQKL